MTVETLSQAIQAISQRIDENKDELIRLDQQNGDGDLGISMSDGFHAVAAYLTDAPEKDLGKALSRCGDHFNTAAPSSLGTILTFIFKGAARTLVGQEQCDLAKMAEALQAGLENVMKKAGSKPGEKTILDALFPAVEALRENAEQPELAFPKAAAAARAGSESTKTMRAVWGRAAYYGDNSIGVLDGGSVAGALIFEALADRKL